MTNFTCPYVNLELRQNCGVTSCNYNLPDNNQTIPYKRCFLNYTDTIRNRPGAAKNEHDFQAFTQEKKNKIASQFLEITLDEVEQVNSNFYLALFSVFAEDVAISLCKHQLDPVPFEQCVVCGSGEDELFYPEGVLPSGYGYCSYSCFQLKPPPILMVEKNMNLEFIDFISAIKHQTNQSRAKFVRQLSEFVLGNTPMRI